MGNHNFSGSSVDWLARPRQYADYPVPDGTAAGVLRTGGMTMALSPDGRTLVTGSMEGGLGIIDAAADPPRVSEAPAITSTTNSNTVLAIAFHPSSEEFAASHVDGVRLFGRDGAERSRLPSPSGVAVTALVFHGDSMLIMGSARGEIVGVRRENQWTRQWALRAFAGATITGLAVHPSQPTLFVASTAGMRAVDLASGLVMEVPLPLGATPLQGVAISPDGRLVVGVRADQGLVFWRAGWPEWLAEGCERMKRHELFTVSGKPGVAIDSIPGLGGIEPYNALDTCGRRVWNAR